MVISNSKLICCLRTEGMLQSLKDLINVPIIVLSDESDVMTLLNQQTCPSFLVVDRCYSQESVMSIKKAFPQTCIVLLTDSSLSDVIPKISQDDFTALNAIINLHGGQEHTFILQQLVDRYVTTYNPALSIANFGGECFENVIVNSVDQYDIVTKIEELLDEIGVRTFQKSFFVDVLVELVNNGIYDAPRTLDNVQKYYKSDRAQNIALSESEIISLKWGYNDNLLWMSITDLFGALAQWHLYSMLSNCYKDSSNALNLNKDEGGSLGFYKIVSCSTNIVVHVTHLKRTEVICVFDRQQTKKEARNAPRSYVFTYSENCLVGDKNE